MRNQNGCSWPECTLSHFASGRADLKKLIDPCELYPIGMYLCRDHMTFLDSIAHFMMLRMGTRAKPEVIQLNEAHEN